MQSALDILGGSDETALDILAAGSDAKKPEPINLSLGPLAEPVQGNTALEVLTNAAQAGPRFEGAPSLKDVGKNLLGGGLQSAAAVPAGVLDTVAILAQKTDKLLGSPKPLDEFATHQYAEAVRDWAREAIPVDPNSPAAKLGGALGSGLSFMAGTGGINAVTKAGPFFTAAFLGGATNGAAQYHEAKAAGASDEDAFSSWALGYGVGNLEAVTVGRMLNRLNIRTNGWLREALIEGGEEGLQELAEGTLNNLIASDLVKYDEDRKLLEGALENVTLGGLAGVILSGVTSAASVALSKPKGVEGAAQPEGATQDVPRGTPDEANVPPPDQGPQPNVPAPEGVPEEALGAEFAGEVGLRQTVITETGEAGAPPVKVYRGRHPTQEGKPLASEVPYFAYEPEYAEEYSRGEDEDAAPIVMEAYLDIRNPARDEDVERVAEEAGIDLISGGTPGAFLEQSPELVAALQAAGYDGVIATDSRLDDRGSITSVAPFSSKQVYPTSPLTDLNQGSDPNAELAPEAASLSPEDKPANSGKPTPESIANGPISIKNASVDATLAEMGLPPATHGEKKQFEKENQAADELEATKPNAGRRLLEELSENIRPIDGPEVVLLTREWNRRRNERNALAAELIEARSKNLPTDRIEADIRQAQDADAEAADIFTKVGTVGAQGLAFRQMMLNDDFSLAAIERRGRVAKKGEALSTEETERLTARVAELEERQRELDAHVARLQKPRTKRETTGSRARKKQEIRKEIQNLWKEAEAAAGRARTGVDTDLARIMFRLASAHIDLKGQQVAEFAEWAAEAVKRLGEKVRPYLNRAWDQAMARVNVFHGSGAEFDRFDSSQIGTGEGAQAYGHGLYFADRAGVAKSYRDAASPKATGWWRREARRLESAHPGEWAALSDEVALVHLDDATFAEDVAVEWSNIFARDKPGAFPPQVFEPETVRAVLATKDVPSPPTSALYQVRLAPAADEYLLHDEQIYAQSARVQAGLDRHIRTPASIESRDQLASSEYDKTYADLDGDERAYVDSVALDEKKPGFAEFDERETGGEFYKWLSAELGSDQAASQALLDAGIRGIKYLDGTSRSKGEGSYNYVVFDDADAQIVGVEGETAERAQSRAAQLRAEIESEWKNVERISKQANTGVPTELIASATKLAVKYIQLGGVNLAEFTKMAVERLGEKMRPYLEGIWNAAQAEVKEDRRTRSATTRLRNQAGKLNAKIEAEDFTKPPKRTPVRLDEEGIALKAEVEAAKRVLNREIRRIERENRTRVERAGAAVKEGINLPRALRASWDFSAPLRQGMVFSLANPVRTLPQLRKMFRATFSEKNALQIETALKEHPLYDMAVRSGVEFTAHPDEMGKREEAIHSEFSDRFPGVKASNRAFITFLNVQRMDSFAKMVQGIPGEATLERTKVLANFVNVATGRGQAGRHTATVNAAGNVLWAPRLLLSRIQLLIGQPLWTGDATTRKLIAAQYARTLTGLAVAYTLAGMMGADIEWDPRSSDFGKLKFGNTRIDPLAGLSQVLVFAYRELKGETKSTRTGRVSSIRGEVDFGRDDGFDVLTRFVRTKLAPHVSIPVDYLLAGENTVGEERKPETEGQVLKFTGGQLAEDVLLPLAWSDVFETFKEQGVARGTAMSIMSIFGWGTATYK